jgi:MFS family permease
MASEPREQSHEADDESDEVLYELPTTTTSALASTAKHRSNIPSLVAALSAAMTTGGTTYAFGLYGNDLKNSLSLTASEVDTISTAFFFAGLLSWLPGLSADRFGARFSIATGGITGSIALMTYWAVATKHIELERSMLVPALSLLGISIFLSCAMITGSVFKIIVTCCGPGTKGSAVGVAKGLVGLGSGAYTCIFNNIRTPNETNLNFLCLAAFLAVMAATVPALLLLPSKYHVDRDIMIDDATPQHFRVLFTSLGVMVVIIVWNSLADLSRHSTAENESEDALKRHLASALFFVVTWLLPIVSLLCLPRRRDGHVSFMDEAQGADDDRGDDENEDTSGTIETLDRTGWNRSARDLSESSVSLQRTSTESQSGTNGVGIDRTEEDTGVEERSLLQHDGNLITEIDQEENKNLVQLTRASSAWLLLWTTTILVGAGTVETNNMGVMVEALGLPPKVTSSSLALFSVAQALGRVATGAVSESALNWNTRRCMIDSGVPRPVFLVLASLVAFLSHFMLGLASRQFFFVLGSMLSGVAFGMVWPLMVLIVGEVFGTANAGANYMFYDGFSSAVGTLLLTKGLAQHVYEGHLAGGSSTCQGQKCFQLTHLLVSVASLTCVVTSAGLVFASRNTYNKQRFHHA